MNIASKNLASIKDLPDVSFIENKTLEDVQAEMVAHYQEKYKEVTGRELKLRRADPEALKLYAASVQVYHLYLYADMGGKMNLIKYAFSDFLDNIAAFKGVDRNPAVPATVKVRFTLSAVQTSVVTIPKGTRVSDGGEEFFATDEAAEISIGKISADIQCTCQTAGEVGNGILAGAINTLVDPIPYMERVASIEESSGGSDIEDDVNFAYRIYLAPSAYSTAGPADAYEYHTKSYSALIGDVKVVSPEPVEVEVRFLLADGSIPTDGLCEEVLEYLNGQFRRPLTDHVTVLAPTEQEFDLDFTFYVNKSDINKAAAIQVTVASAVEEYVQWQTFSIGRDINPDMLRRILVAAGAKRVEIRSPDFTRVDPNHVARIKAKNVVYGGVEDD